MRDDIIIKNGTVFDGLGNPPIRADIGIAGDKIERIGDLKNEEAPEIIDATGKYVAPGFIDLTNHSDTHWTIFSSPAQESMLRQGITTIIGGNCGSSLAPFTGETSMEELSRWTDVSKLNINWNSVEEFFGKMTAQKIGVNFGTMIGLGTLQKTVLGGEIRTPDEREIGEIKFLLKESLRAGAFGVSANLGLSHARSQDDGELIDILSIAAEFDAVCKHHLEDEGENVLPALSRVINIAEKSGTNVHIAHLKILGKKSWPLAEPAVRMIENFTSEKTKVTADFFPYTRTGSNLIMLFPSWFRNLATDEKMKILTSKQEPRRRELLEYFKGLTLHYDKIIVASAGYLGRAGKTIDELARGAEMLQEEFILNLMEANNLRVSVFNEVISEEGLDFIAKADFSALSSDGVGYNLPDSSLCDLPHPRSFGAFPRAFELFVKKKQIVSWEKMIFKASGLPAKILGIKERGTIEKNKKADIILLDPDKLSSRSDYYEPFKYAEGVDWVLVNGQIIISAGKFSGKLSGNILKRK